MLDSVLLRLLEDAVNTSCKLALVMLFAENERFVATPQQLAARLCRDPWSVDTAVRELVTDGVLALRDGRVTYQPTAEWPDAIRQLRVSYDDPYRRDTIISIVRDLDRYAPYRDEMRSRRVTVMAA